MKAPIKNFVLKSYPSGSITQWFGENLELYMKAIGTSGHNGIDIVAPYGTPIYSVEDCKVVATKHDPRGYGRHVKTLGEHECTYGHLAEINVVEGDFIKTGDLIGKMGNSGFVISGPTPFWEYNPYKGTHLHLTVRERGGNKWMAQYPTGDKIYIKDYENGFKGAIDPRPLFEPSEEEIKQLQLTIISLANHVIILLKKIINLKLSAK